MKRSRVLILFIIAAILVGIICIAADTPQLTANGQSISYTVGKDSSLELRPSDAVQQAWAEDPDTLRITVPDDIDAAGIVLELDLSLLGSKRICVTMADGSSVTYSAELMSEFSRQAGGEKITLSARFNSGSAVLTAETADAQPLSNTPACPVLLKLACSDTRALFKDADGKYVPRSWQTNGHVYGLTNANGTYTFGAGLDAEFTDTTGRWMESGVEALASRAVVNGTGNGKFTPNTPITRAEFVTMFMRFLGTDYDTGAAADFSDLGDIPSWAQAAIYQAQVLGYLEDEETFRPNDPMLREDVCEVLARYYRTLGHTSGNTPNASIAFNDKGDANPARLEAIELLCELGLIRGYNDGTFLPKGTITRAESAQLLCNMLNDLRTRSVSRSVFPENEVLMEGEQHWYYPDESWFENPAMGAAVKLPEAWLDKVVVVTDNDRIKVYARQAKEEAPGMTHGSLLFVLNAEAKPGPHDAITGNGGVYFGENETHIFYSTVYTGNIPEDAAFDDLRESPDAVIRNTIKIL